MSEERKAALVDTIAYAIKHSTRGDGMTARRFETADAPGRLLAVLKTANGRVACDVVRTTLDSMEQDKYTQALRHALGGDGYAKSLEERRQRLAAETGASPSTLRRYEATATRALALKVADALQDEPENMAMAAEQPCPDPLVTALVGLRMAMAEQTTVLREILSELKRIGN